jgi:hypothetical protein
VTNILLLNLILIEKEELKAISWFNWTLLSLVMHPLPLPPPPHSQHPTILQELQLAASTETEPEVKKEKKVLELGKV